MIGPRNAVKQVCLLNTYMHKWRADTLTGSGLCDNYSWWSWIYFYALISSSFILLVYLPPSTCRVHASFIQSLVLMPNISLMGTYAGGCQ